MVVGSDFGQGSASPQIGLVELIGDCRRNYSQQIKLPKEGWSDAVTFDGIIEGYQLTQTKYCFGSKKREIRLVVKRELLKSRLTYLASIDTE